MAEEPDVGQRLDQAAGGRNPMVFSDGDRFLFPLDCGVGGGADGARGGDQGDLRNGIEQPRDIQAKFNEA